MKVVYGIYIGLLFADANSIRFKRCSITPKTITCQYHEKTMKLDLTIYTRPHQNA